MSNKIELTQQVQGILPVANGGTGSSTLQAITWVTEIPSGTINGSNTSFTLAHAPSNNEAVVTLDGLKQYKTTDYSISGTALTFVVAPFTGAVLEAFYAYGTNAVVTPTQTTLDLGTVPVYNKKVTATDASATTSSKIHAWVQAKSTNLDDLEMDNLLVSANCTTNGTINFYVAAIPGPVSGSYTVNYTIG